VSAKPNAHSNEIRGLIEGALKVAVAAALEKWKANQAIIRLLSRLLEIPKTRFNS
jgi:uncharacterized protein YggU (UPF0235/DUF167 family)